jgi:hypothetical protein
MSPSTDLDQTEGLEDRNQGNVRSIEMPSHCKASRKCMKNGVTVTARTSRHKGQQTGILPIGKAGTEQGAELQIPRKQSGDKSSIKISRTIGCLLLSEILFAVVQSARRT